MKTKLLNLILKNKKQVNGYGVNLTSIENQFKFTLFLVHEQKLEFVVTNEVVIAAVRLCNSVLNNK